MTARIGAECSLSKNFKKNCTPNSWRPSRSVFDFIQLLSQSRENSYPVHIHVVTPVDLVEDTLLPDGKTESDRIPSCPVSLDLLVVTGLWGNFGAS